MDWTLARFEYTPTSTVGALYDEKAKFICYSLEDACRQKKIQDQTAIPSGRYALDYTHSGRFNKMLPLLIDVPYFFAIRLHGGNQITDTAGCPLLGLNKAFTVSGGTVTWYIRDSQLAMNEMIPKYEAIINSKQPFSLTILGGYSASEMTNA